MELKSLYGPVYILQSQNVRYWATVVTKKDGEPAIIKTYHGLVGSPIQTKVREVHEGKNLGKANETTSYEQACLEANYEYELKQRKGYVHDNIGNDTIDAHRQVWTGAAQHRWDLPPQKIVGGVPLAMKLHHLRTPDIKKGHVDYSKKKPIKFPVMVQPKKDGVFACVNKDFGIMTRGGKDRLSPKGQSWATIVPHIVDAIEELDVDLIFNGEMFIPNSTLQTITSANQKYTCGVSEQMQLWLFDIVDTKMPALLRWQHLKELEKLIMMKGLHNVLKVIPSQVASTWEQVYTLEEKWLEQGEEGIVVRHVHAKYTIGKRSTEHLKLVRLDRSEVEIVDIIPMENEPSHGLFVCRYNGQLFNVTPSQFTHEEREQLLNLRNFYKGKKLTIEHRGYTDGGIPRIAKGISIRENE